MNLDPAWVGLAGVAAVWAGGLIKDWITYRREEKRRVREEKQRSLEAQKIVYIDYLDVFSKPMPHQDSEVLVELIGTYIKTAINVNKFGEVRLSERVNLEDYAHRVFDIYASYGSSWEDDDELKKFLKKTTGWDWIETGKIEKTENGKTIRDSVGERTILLEINNKKTEVIFKHNDFVYRKFIAKMEHDTLYIYDPPIVFKEFEKNKIYDLEIQSMTDIIKELFKIRYTTYAIEKQHEIIHVIELIRRICIEEFGRKYLENLIEHR